MEMLDAVRWADRDLRGRELRGASLRGASLKRCRLDDADLRGADLWGADLAMASLRRADLRGARLSCASFAGADLRAARLGGAELVFCDLGGAHLACADFGRPRTTRHHVLARRIGCPSFADALGCSYLEASRMRAGLALLAIDAALDVSPDPEREIRALLGADDWRVFVLGAMAVARRAAASPELVALLRERLSPRDVGAAAAAALLSAGHAPDALRELCPALAAPADPYREAPLWSELLRARLEHIRAWPRPDARPEPQPWL